MTGCGSAEILPGSIWTSTSSGSGKTATVAALVWATVLLAGYLDGQIPPGVRDTRTLNAVFDNLLAAGLARDVG